MNTPVNGETFLPQLIADYLTAQATALGLPTALNICAWPFLGEFTRPYIGIEASSFSMDGHPGLQKYDVIVMLDYGVDGDPAPAETAAQAKARRVALLTAENTILSMIRAALSLRPGETFTATGAVKSLWNWLASDRTAPAGEDFFNLEEFIIAAGGGSMTFDKDKRIRQRITNYTARLQTNEFTPAC